MVKNCDNCTDKCPQAEVAKQAALGRMYATKEFIALMKKVESGELVPVVRCKDCKYWDDDFNWCDRKCVRMQEDDFCSYGERRTDGR